MSGRGSRYVEITRKDLEDWLKNLSALGFPKGYKRDQNFQGIYLIHLSEFVSVKLTSTIGGNEKNKGLGKASTNMTLVSRLYPRMVLNRKSRDRKHFQRTKNWRTTWLDALKHWKEIYTKASDFYDNIARVENRDEYRQDWIACIEQIPSWSSKEYLVKYHQSLTDGRILFPNQEELIKKIIKDQAKKTNKEINVTLDVELLRRMYVVARQRNEQMAMQRIKELGLQATSGAFPSPKDKEDYRSLRQYFGM